MSVSAKFVCDRDDSGSVMFLAGCGLLYGILGIFLQETEKFLFDMRKIYGTVLMLSAAVGINPVAVMSQGIPVIMQR